MNVDVHIESANLNRALDGNLYIAIGLATERIARAFERELEWAQSVGAVRNSEAAVTHSRRRRFK